LVVKGLTEHVLGSAEDVSAKPTGELSPTDDGAGTPDTSVCSDNVVKKVSEQLDPLRRSSTGQGEVEIHHPKPIEEEPEEEETEGQKDEQSEEKAKSETREQTKEEEAVEDTEEGTGEGTKEEKKKRGWIFRRRVKRKGSGKGEKNPAVAKEDLE
jgi:hypothetical protein